VRIAFVFIPRFPCAVEVQRNPHLAGKPMVIGDAEQPKSVFDCSDAAALHGVRAGMPIRQALARCPDAVILPPDPVLYRARWEAVLEALANVSPEVEDEDLGRAYFNATGLSFSRPPISPLSAGRGAGGEVLPPSPKSERGPGDEVASHITEAVRAAVGLEARVGLADGKFPAFAAATLATSGEPGSCFVVPAGGEGGFLAPLSVEILPVDPEIIFRLQLFGLETIGEVASLTLPELQSQFGFEGKRLWHLVNGRDEEPLRPRPASEKVEASLSFEAPVAGIEVMVAASKQLLSRLRPALRGRAARELVLQAELASDRGWEKRLVLREAVSESDRLAFVLRSSLQNAPPPNAVRSITLRLAGLTGETGKQLALGERGRLQRQLAEAIRQLKARYGYSPVFNCVDVEPWSVIPEERQILVESDA
jgi:nucleotidyltransferase/DNA polymerase involved in DNA repair